MDYFTFVIILELPAEFFDIDSMAPSKTSELTNAIRKLTPRQTEHIMLIVKDLTEK